MVKIVMLVLLGLWSVDSAKFPLKMLINSPTVPPIVYRDTYPYMVSIRNRRGDYLCGGALISKNYVLTAAHCFGDHPSTTWFSVYTHSSTLSKQIDARIQNVTVHPEYRHAFNDLALVKLKNIPRPAITPVEISRLPVGKVPLTVLGWGSTSAEPLVFSNVLRIFRGEAITPEDCSRKFHNVEEEQHLCFSGGENATSAACRGDSGSPVLHDGKIVGVVSVVPQNCTPGEIEVAVRLAPKYIKWIEDNTK